MMIAVIKMIERENVVEWGAADGVVSSSHSQSYPAVVARCTRRRDRARPTSAMR
jgi:hypothetical protein